MFSASASVSEASAMLFVSISFLTGLFLPLSGNESVAGTHRAVGAGQAARAASQTDK